MEWIKCSERMPEKEGRYFIISQADLDGIKKYHYWPVISKYSCEDHPDIGTWTMEARSPFKEIPMYWAPLPDITEVIKDLQKDYV